MNDIIINTLFDIINEYSKIEVNESNYNVLDLLVDCDYNSIQIIELICTIEDLFDIVMDDDYYLFENIRNIAKLYEYIKTKISCKESV